METVEDLKKKIEELEARIEALESQRKYGPPPKPVEYPPYKPVPFPPWKDSRESNPWAPTS